MQISAILLILLFLLVSSYGNVELCSKCLCYKKVLIQSLYTINCSHLSLQDTFPDLQQWPDYAQQEDTRIAVNFDWNDITHLKKFPKIPGIVSMSLRHNKMTHIEGIAFVQLDNLKSLDLSNNLLTAEGVQAEIFRGHYSPKTYDALGIVVLNLGHNMIESLGPYSFEHLPNLTELRLNNNPLKILDSNTLTALGSPEKLQVLDLAYTGLSDLPEEVVHLSSIHHKLQLLYLNGNQFTEVPDSIAALGDSLQKLNLNDNPISELNEDSFRGLLALRELNISAMSQLQRIGPSTFGHLKNLEILHCSYNKKLTELDEEAFEFGVNTWTLKELHLRNNALHSLPKQLAPWKSLDIVDVQDNPWRCDCDLEWFVSDLVPVLENTTPDLVLELHCSEPLWMSGVNVMSFRNPSNSPSLCDNVDRPPAKSMKTHRSGLYVAFEAASIILVISTAAGLLVLFYLQRRRNLSISIQMLISPNVRYVKTRNEV